MQCNIEMELNRQGKECRRNLAIVQPSLRLNMRSKIIVDKGNRNTQAGDLKKSGTSDGHYSGSTHEQQINRIVIA